jgi:hypothetical protein
VWLFGLIEKQKEHINCLLDLGPTRKTRAQFETQNDRQTKVVKVIFLVLILTSVSAANAQSLWSRARDGVSWYWGQAKTGTIRGAVNGWDTVMGNSCGDYTPRTLQAIERAPSCSAKRDLEDAVESAFFSAGARMTIQDDDCQMQRFARISASPSHLAAFQQDLQAKVPDLRARYREIQKLKAEIDQAQVLIRRSDGPVAPQNADYYIKHYGPKIDYLEKKTQEFNALVFSSPIAHFEAGQKFLMDVVTRGAAPTPGRIRATYLEGMHDVQQDRQHWLKQQTSPGQFTLDRSEKIALLKSGHTETWFKPGAQSAEEAKRVMCNISRVYVKGETVVNWGLSIGSYALGAEGCLVKVAWAARFAAVAGRARMGLVSLETMNMLSWGLATTSAIDSAVRRCRIPRTQVTHSGPSCSIDPNSEVVLMENANCALGLAMAAGTMGFAAGTTAIGKRALARASEAAAPVVDPIVVPLKNAAQKLGRRRQ